MLLAHSTILVADENLGLAKSLAEILEAEGAEVSLAGDAAQAMDIADSRPLEVALVDARLAFFAQHLLEGLRRRAPAIEVILLAGNAHIERAQGPAFTGVYALAFKPLDTETLVGEVAKAVRLVRSTRETAAVRDALVRCEAGLEAVVGTAHALFLVLDESGRVVRANEAAAEVTGRPISELVGVPWFETFVPEEDRADAKRAFRQILAGTEPVFHQNRVQRIQPGGRHEARWVRWKALSLRDERGGALVYASGLDTSDTRELERRARLTEKLAAVGTLSAGLAHEIRNPLNAAGLQLRLLTRRLEAARADASLLEPVALVHAELGRLSRLVGDFLQFARPTGLVRSRVDVVALTRAVVDLEAPAAMEKGARISARLPGGPALVEGDSEKLRQVILNLIRNAVEASGKDGRVEVGVEIEEDGLLVCVSDDGEGIPEAELARIFEPFFSTKPGGTGLGMSIVHSLVAQHGGEVTVDSRQGEGTRVVVSLPAVAP